MSTYAVQVVIGRNGPFEDVYVEARSEAAALRKAPGMTRFSPTELRWARAVFI